MTCLLLLALLVATVVQSAHACGALLDSTYDHGGAQVHAAAPAVCPICVMFHGATTLSLPTLPAPAMRTISDVRAADGQARAFLTLFSLNVRPPPA